MAIMAALALAGVVMNVLGEAEANQEKKYQAYIHKRANEFQRQISSQMFAVEYPRLVQQQRAELGTLATGYAKGGVAGESASVLASLNEQVRVHSMNRSIAKYQQNLEQRGFDLEDSLTKRAINQLSANQGFILASGVVNGLNQGFEKGVFTESGVSSLFSRSNSATSLISRSASPLGPPTLEQFNAGRT